LEISHSYVSSKLAHCIYRALQTQPNAAHKLLAKLSVPKYLKTVAPAAKTFHLITQNVDGLSVAALRSLAGEFPNTQARSDRVRMDSVLPMHGSLFDVKCTKCGHTVEDLSNPLCPSLGVADLQLNDYVDAGSKEISIAEGDLPRCQLCGALARPGVVWFDEKPYKFDEINSLVYKADMCLVIGTSSTVCALYVIILSELWPHFWEGAPRINVCISCPTSRRESGCV
jgi:NAD-dependent deacetylase sirtuin 5